MIRAIMRHVADNQLHVVDSKAGYAAPDWVFVRDLAVGEDPAFLAWSGGQAIQNTAKLEAALLAAIDAQRENLQMTVLTAGGAKKYVYNRKAVEAIDSRGLLVSVLNALSLVDKQKRFPFAQAEAALTGETLSSVLARYEAALNTSAAKVAALEATAQKAKRAVRAATTPVAKRAAANVTWSTP